MKHLGRVSDTLVYSRLVRAQLELRVIADRPGDIPQALAKLGPGTWNLYTGQPFAWDQEHKTLWAEMAVKLGTGSADDPSNQVMKAVVTGP